MAASLANGGLCPLSGDQVLSPASVRSMMSMMQVAGMKESSTAFLHKTSVPAVSSGHGVLLAAVPGVLGLMAFSPEVDSFGNPWRALHFCQFSLLEISGDFLFFFPVCPGMVSTFQLHSFDVRASRQVLVYRQWKSESEVGPDLLSTSTSTWNC
uniref:glutaminase n=1 Tax=Cynoglossus semilaevis TaxID=244447 RepID=A0A3P8X6F2_CYNSE